MKKIIALGGSSAKQSINKTFASYAANLVQNASVETLDLNDFEMPLYSIDLENEKGIPSQASSLLDKIQSADGIVLSLAEHNGAYAAAFKNAFDWMSRLDGKLWGDIPMLLLATSPGGRGGVTVLEIAKSRFPYMGGNIVGSMALPFWDKNFQNGELVDSEIKASLLEEVKKL